MTNIARRDVLFGLLASPAAAAAEPPLAGRTFVVALESAALGETRHVGVYLPPTWRKAERYPVLYLADGQFMGPYARDLEAMMLAGKLRPLVIIGLWSSERGGQPRRQEYLAGYGGGARRHAASERFFLEGVMPMAQASFGAANDPAGRMVAGYSDGGSWALTTALSHPDQFGQAAALSISWEPSGAGIESPTRPRLFLGCGDSEPYYRDTTSELARRAKRSPVEVVYRTARGAHEPAVWRPLMSEAALWAFGTKGSDGL